jgi:hypothetical protein
VAPQQVQAGAARSRAARQPEPFDELLIGALIALWRLRVEIVVTMTLTAVFLAAGDALGGVGGAVLVLALVAVLLAPARSRRWLSWRLHVSRVRRWWARSVPLTGLATPDGRIPRVCRVLSGPAGEQVLVELPVGQSAAFLERHRDVLAAAAGVRDVRVHGDPGNAKYAWVTLVRRDPLDASEPLAWPRRDAGRLSLWDPIPVGLDELGRWVEIALPERNLLLGGEPGAGKSAALSMIVATGAFDPDVNLWLLDGKLVELAAWSPCARRTVGVELDEALELLRNLRAEMDDRYQRLLADGLRKVSREDGLPLHLVVCDELAFYLTGSDRKQRAEITDLFRDLVARGRAAGIIMVAATQKPAVDVVPSALRDLFGFRWALRCNTPQASDTILGQGWASMGFAADTVAGYQRGVGYLLAEEGRPRRLRACYLDDQAIDELATRAHTLRTTTTT